MERFTADTIAVVKQLYARVPPLLLIGHSLGAALAVHVANSKQVRAWRLQPGMRVMHSLLIFVRPCLVSCLCAVW